MRRYAMTQAGEVFSIAKDEPTPAGCELVAVIQFEDREQVERLSLAMRMPLTIRLPQADRLQAALREFANPTPPKPAQPTGLGAVVEDADGKRWVRTDPEQPAWTEWDRPVNRYPYDRITAVRVLSEGVTP